MTLHVQTRGSGPDLALVHGWGFGSNAWSGFGDLLAERYRVHSVDLPGYGGSREIPFEGLEETAAAVAAVIPDGARVCGWSLGALVSMRLATLEQRRLHSLVLIAATPCFVARTGWTTAMDGATFASFDADIRAAPRDTLRRFARLNAIPGQCPREVIRKLERALEDSMPAVLPRGLELLGATDIRDEVAAIRLPVLLLHGVHDAIVPLAAARWLAGSIDGARLATIEGAAHAPFLSHPAACAAAVEDFCDG